MAIWADLRVSRAPALALAAIGLAWGALSAALPVIKTQSGVDDAGFGLVMMLSAAGGMVAMALAPRLGPWLGGRALPLAAGIVALAVPLPALAEGPVTLALAILGFGAAMSFCDILGNIRIAEIEAAQGRSLMNLNHAVFSLAFAASAALIGGARQSGIALPAALILVMAAVALCALAMGRAPEAAAPVDAPKDPALDSSGPAPWAIIWPGAMMLWLSFSAENGVEAWSALHIERTLGLPDGLGAYGPAMFGLMMGLARLAGQGLAQRWGEVRLIRFCVLAGLIGAVALAFAPGLWLAMAGAAALGLGLSVVVPSANTLIARTVSPAQRASALARAWTIGFAGFFVGPPLLGMISAHLGLRAAMAAIALMLALMLPTLAALTRRLR